MRDQAPRCVGLEHLVLQHIFPRICPVVRDIGTGVIAHHIRCPGRRARWIVRIGTFLLRLHRLPDETVHPPTVDIGGGIRLAVRSAAVDIERVVVRTHAPAVRIGYTHVRRQPVGPGKRSEVRVEGPVLLHDHDHVLNRVNTLRCPRDGRCRARMTRRNRRDRDHHGRGKPQPASNDAHTLRRTFVIDGPTSLTEATTPSGRRQRPRRRSS
jgi:hypothetical protein